jgi:hypothetical protein
MMRLLAGPTPTAGSTKAVITDLSSLALQHNTCGNSTASCYSVEQAKHCQDTFIATPSCDEAIVVRDTGTGHCMS